MKILVTGSSGFIGSALVADLLRAGHEVAGLDRKAASLEGARHLKVDLMDADALRRAVVDFGPEVVVHLAAKTSLKTSVPGSDRFEANTKGTMNLVAAMAAAGTVRRALYASTKYVHRGSEVRVPARTYAPDTEYGASKAAMEEALWEAGGGCREWGILRPTTIWGPGFGPHYRRFLELVRSGRYFHAGSRTGRKHMGYIENTVFQIRRLVEAPAAALERKIFYLGDYEAVEVRRWADEFRRAFGSRRIPTLPRALARVAAGAGDLLAAAGWKKFPLTSFRLRNLAEDDLCDLEPTREVCGELPVDFEEAVARTAAWYLKTRA